MADKSKPVNLNELSLLLRAANEDFEGAQRMKRDDIGSQDSSFRNSFDSNHLTTPKPSIIPAMDARDTYKGYSNSVHFENLHNISSGSAFLADRAESEAGGLLGSGKKSTNTSMHMGPHLNKDRVDMDPKLKSLGSEISKRITEMRNNDDGPEVVALGNESLAFDETMQQKTTCQHCLMIRRKVIVPKQKEGNVDFLYCDKHVPVGGKGLTKSKSPMDRTKVKASNLNMPGTSISRSKTPPKKVILDPKPGGKDVEELKKLIEVYERDLYDANEEMKKMGYENNALKEEMEGLEDAKDQLARQLVNANKAYKESMVKVESLLERIKRHLGTDLKLYDKILSEKGDKGEVPAMKTECEELLRLIKAREWVTVQVKESEEFLEQLEEARRLRKQLVNMKAEDKMNKDVIGKLERYIKELEEQVENLQKDPKNANKNNIMKVLQLSKEIKENGIKEAELARELENAKFQIYDLQNQLEGGKANKKRLDEIQRELNEKEEELDRAIYAGSRPKVVVSADVEDAIRQLSMIILSKETDGISEQTRALLKDVFPAAFSKNIAQYEQRVRELEEQNKRLLDDYNEEIQKGAMVTRTAKELCGLLLELLIIFDNNKAANLPPGLKKFRDELYEDREKLEMIYEELEEGLKDYDRKLQKRGRESMTLDANRLGLRNSNLTSTAPMFGFTKHQSKNGDVDEETMLKKTIKERDDIKERLETVQIENSALGVQLNHYKNKEEGMQRAMAEMKAKYEAILKGKGIPTDNLNMSRVLKMGGRSVEESFSVLNDDPNWWKTKVGESVDYLMMMHVQAGALEEKIRRNDELEMVGRMFETSVSRKEDRTGGGYQRGFSFTNEFNQ